MTDAGAVSPAIWDAANSNGRTAPEKRAVLRVRSPGVPPIQARRWDGGFGTIERNGCPGKSTAGTTRDAIGPWTLKRGGDEGLSPPGMGGLAVEVGSIPTPSTKGAYSNYLSSVMKMRLVLQSPALRRGHHNAGEAGCNPGKMQSMVNLGKLAEMADCGGLLIR